MSALDDDHTLLFENDPGTTTTRLLLAGVQHDPQLALVHLERIRSGGEETHMLTITALADRLLQALTALHGHDGTEQLLQHELLEAYLDDDPGEEPPAPRTEP